MPVGRTYSDRYLLQDKKDEIDEMSADYIYQQATRDRVKRLSAETNRRRKALEQKKKLEAEKEAKRRTEVLEERRKRQQEATQRYQRLSRASPKKTHSRKDVAYSGARLQEGVQMARGYKINDKPSPAVEDVLRMVGHQDRSSYAHPPLTTDLRDDTTSSYQSIQQSRELSNLDRNGNTIKHGSDHTYHQKYHGYSTKATPTHDSQVTAPMAQQHQYHPADVERELVLQQKVFIEQQKKSLMDFNQALLQESSSKNVDLECSSVSSVDSLEEGKKPLPRRLTFDDEDSLDGIHKVNHLGGSVVGGGTFHYGADSVQDLTPNANSQLSQENSHSSIHESQVSGKLVSGTTKVDDGQFLSSHSTSESHLQSHMYPNQHYEQNSSHCSQATSSPQQQYLPTTVGTNSHSQSNNYQTESELNNSDSASYKQGRNTHNMPSYMWDHSGTKPGKSAPFKGSAPQVTGPQPSPKYADGKARGFSAKTSATPLVASKLDNQHINRTMENDRREVSGNIALKHDSNSLYRHENVDRENVDCDTKCEDGDSNRDCSTPKSILKKVSVYSTLSSQEDKPTPKWGKNELRDSMDIASATQIKRTPSKKSVRWTDLAYSETDDSQMNSQNSKAVSSQARAGATATTAIKSKSAVTNARIVQQKLTASNDMEQTNGKGPVLLFRNAFRSKVGSQDSKSTSQVQSRQETKPLQNRNHSTPTGKPPSGKSETAKLTPKRINGFTLNKTPTDDEINQLWDKVRTCLNSRESTPEPKVGGTMRRAASDQSLSESGQRLTANLKVVPSQKGQISEQNKLKKFHTVPRWRTSSDSGTNISKRATLLQRQPDKQGKRITSAEGWKRSPGNPPVPVSSHGGPNRSAGTQHEEVNDSLLAFQQAELLVQQNFTEAEIEAALDHQVPDHHSHGSKALSALSLEEQRILESLDRLNEKLRITSDISTNYSAMTPRPPAYGSGFRAYRQVSSKAYGTNSPGRPGLRVRSSSADRENSRIWNYR